MTLKVTITLDGEESNTHFTPGLPDNDKSEAVLDSLAALKAALSECLALPHDPNRSLLHS